MTLTTLPTHLMPMVEKAAEQRLALWPNDIIEFDDMKYEAGVVILAFLNACLDDGVAKLDPEWEHPALCTSIILSLGEAK